MAISPIGNMLHVNQNMGVAASSQNDFQARLDAQNLAMSEAAAKEKREVEEIRATDEAYKIDPENEHNKKNSQQNNKNSQKQDFDENLNKDDLNSDEKPILDIKI